MRTYIARRLILFPPTLFGVSMLIFVMMRILPGDVAVTILSGDQGGRPDPRALAELREALHLDQPLYRQYLDWAGGLARLDPGVSLYTRLPIRDEIKQRFPVTLELAVLAILISLVVAIPIGVISALKQDTWVDYVFRVLSISALAVPGFWLAILTIMVLALKFHWVPNLTWVSPFKDPGANLQQIIWPAMILGLSLSAIVSRMTRSQTLEIMRMDYVRTAWSKGLDLRVIVSRHVLKNAMLPIVTIVGLQTAGLLGGTVILEQIFALPGLGSTLVGSIQQNDYPVTQTMIVLFSLIVMTANLVVDVLYAWLDPRVKYT